MLKESHWYDITRVLCRVLLAMIKHLSYRIPRYQAGMWYELWKVLGYGCPKVQYANGCLTHCTSLPRFDQQRLIYLGSTVPRLSYRNSTIYPRNKYRKRNHHNFAQIKNQPYNNLPMYFDVHITIRPISIYLRTSYKSYLQTSLSLCRICHRIDKTKSRTVGPSLIPL